MKDTTNKEGKDIRYGKKEEAEVHMSGKFYYLNYIFIRQNFKKTERFLKQLKHISFHSQDIQVLPNESLQSFKHCLVSMQLFVAMIRKFFIPQTFHNEGGSPRLNEHIANIPALLNS